MGNRWGIAAALAIVCAAVAAGCGASSPNSGTPQVQGPQINVPLRLADCTDWNKSDVSQRLGTVGALRAFAGGPTGSPAGHGNTLPDKRAYDLLQNYCGNFFARGFKLYKLYTRAAAFSPIQR
jgi:hypothetical protein